MKINKHIGEEFSAKNIERGMNNELFSNGVL